MSKSFYIHKKNGTSIHIAAPSQHKHKIKHDKTTKQTSRFYLYDSDTIVIHIRTYLYMFARLYQYKYKSIL